MFDCPDEACHEYRIIPADVAGVLLLDQRIDQHLKGGLGVSNEWIVGRGRLDESAEHHPVVGRMRDVELYVSPGHCIKADPPRPFRSQAWATTCPGLRNPSLPTVASRACLSAKCRYSALGETPEPLAHGPQVRCSTPRAWMVRSASSRSA